MVGTAGLPLVRLPPSPPTHKNAWPRQSWAVGMLNRTEFYECNYDRPRSLPVTAADSPRVPSPGVPLGSPCATRKLLIPLFLYVHIPDREVTTKCTEHRPKPPPQRRKFAQEPPECIKHVPGMAPSAPASPPCARVHRTNPEKT